MRLALTYILVLFATSLKAQSSFSPKLTQFLLSHPKASLAISNVFATASSQRVVQIYYFYTGDESAPKAHHHYLGDSSTVGIFVRENQHASDECISILFELLNSKGEKRFRELWGLAKSGGISKVDFVRETQRQEYQAALDARNIIRTFDLKPEEIAESKSYGYFMKTPDDFNAFLERSRKVSQGADQKSYEDLYEKIRKTEKQ